MAWLGMGITQGDTYDEVYHFFMEEYDKGLDVKEITDLILHEYGGDSPDDPEMNEVYFALAKAQ